MDKVQQILTIAGAVLGIIVTATGFLIPLVKNAKARKALETINRISAEIQPLVRQAEKFVGYNGVAKKQYVMTALNDYAIKHGLDFDEAAVSDLIEQVVKTTKEVNARDKEMPAAESTENPTQALQGATQA